MSSAVDTHAFTYDSNGVAARSRTRNKMNRKDSFLRSSEEEAVAKKKHTPGKLSGSAAAVVDYSDNDSVIDGVKKKSVWEPSAPAAFYWHRHL